MGVLPTPDPVTGESHFRGVLQGTLGESNFWLALMVMIYPAIWWGWAPPMDWVLGAGAAGSDQWTAVRTHRPRMSGATGAGW